MATNNFLPFCPTDTGTNLLTQADYIAATDRDIGNQPGVASAKLNNKAIRQATFISSQLAQYISDQLSENVADDGNTSNFLAQIVKTFSGIVNTTAKTTTYAIGVNDYLITCSGSAFTVTLPTAVGRKKVYVIKKTDSSLTNIITVATTSAQTIDGVTTTTLNTLGETVTLVSDGANWQVVDRQIPSAWASYTPVLTTFGTVSNVEFLWRRDAADILIRGKFTQGTPTGSEARFSLPVTSADTSVIPSIQLSGDVVFDAALAAAWYTLIEPSTAYLTWSSQSASANGLSKLNSSASSFAAGQKICITARVPVAGWNG